MSRDEDGTVTDRVLVRRVLDLGDERAFRTLYRRHTPALYRFALRMLDGDEAEAEDVIQDAWLRAARALGRFRWDAALRSWLTGIVLNAARERLRRRARGNGDRALPAPRHSRPASVPERVDLEWAIRRLPEGYRTVLVLHDIEGFTHEEIGRQLEISPVTSRTQLHRARRAVRALLDPRSEDARDG